MSKSWSSHRHVRQTSHPRSLLWAGITAAQGLSSHPLDLSYGRLCLARVEQEINDFEAHGLVTVGRSVGADGISRVLGAVGGNISEALP